MSKRLVDWNWYSNGKRVYYNLTCEVKNADARTFEPLNHVWARDEARVFHRDKILRSADRQTFHVLNKLFAKDACTVFHTEGPINEADSDSFLAFDADSNCGLRSYAKDKNNVYHRVFTIGKPVVVRMADPGSFRSLGRGFGIDKKSVFYETNRLKGADPATWQLLPGGQYSRDARSVYFGSRLVSGADPCSLEVLPGLHLARDSHKYFRDFTTINKGEYFKELRKHFVFTGSVVRATVTDSKGQLVEGADQADSTREQGLEFQINCDEILFAPDIAVEGPPIAGKDIRMVQRFQSCDISHWIGKKWIWFFHALAPPNARRITPMQSWRDFSPIDDLDRINSLIDEWDPGSAQG